MTDLHDKEEDFAHASLHKAPPPFKPTYAEAKDAAPPFKAPYDKTEDWDSWDMRVSPHDEAILRARSLKSAAPPPPTRALPADSAERKTYPMAAGLLDYFPDALAEVAHISFLGNQKHNPGEPLHWARGKSMDHADCVIRHLTERGTCDAEGVRHSAQLAWRALALLQQEMGDELLLPPPRGTVYG